MPSCRHIFTIYADGLAVGIYEPRVVPKDGRRRASTIYADGLAVGIDAPRVTPLDGRWSNGAVRNRFMKKYAEGQTTPTAVRKP